MKIDVTNKTHIARLRRLAGQFARGICSHDDLDAIRADADAFEALERERLAVERQATKQKSA